MTFFKTVSRRNILALPAALALPTVIGVTKNAEAGNGVVLLLNARNPTSSVGRGETKNIFTGKTSFWHGVVPVKLFSRPTDSEAAKAFFQPVLGMSAQSFIQHWNKLQLAGKGVAPPQVAQAKDLAKKVAQVPGGIGFVLASEAWDIDGVKIIDLK